MNPLGKIKKMASDKNNKQMSLNIVWSFAIKGMAMLISLLIVPAYTDFFNNDDVYGTWLTLSSVFIWINMFDFGIGNGLRNLLVKSISEKDDVQSRKYISSAYISVGIISICFLIVGMIVIWCVDWNAILKIGSDVVYPITFKMFIAVIFSAVVLHFFLLLISSICYALQKTYLPGLISLITHIILLLFLFVPLEMDMQEKLISLSVVYFLAYNVPIFIVSIVIFSTVLKNAKPSFKEFDKSSAKGVMQLGGVFFVIQLATIAINSSNEIFINAFFKPSDVVQYQYYHRLFNVFAVAFALLFQPIWSAMTKAYYEHRYQWIKKVYFGMFGIGLVISLVSVVLAFIYQPVADIWLGKGVLDAQLTTALLFSAFTLFYLVSDVSNLLSNGIGALKCQLICSIIGAVLKPIAIVIMRNVFDITAWEVVMIASIIAYVPLFTVHPIYLMKYINGKKLVN